MEPSTSLQPPPSPPLRKSDAGRSVVFLRWLLRASVPLLALGWLAFYLAGGRVAAWVAQRFPGIIEKAGGSKVPDAAAYVSGLLFDGMWILSVSLLALFAGLFFWHRVVQRLDSKTSFLWGAAGFFVLVNLWSYGMGKSALFWLVLRGTSVENQAQFRVKEQLLNQINDRPVLALVGSSQTQAQFVEESFNKASAGAEKTPWLMELHFPGSLASDVFFVSQRWDRDEVDGFVYYLSPLAFYAANDSAVGRDLMRLRDAAEMIRLGTWQHLLPTSKRYIALGMAMPLFQYRPVLQHALFGFANAKSVPLPQAVSAAPPAEVRREVSTIQVTPFAEYQKRAFTRFLEKTAEKGQPVILIDGQFNPLHEEGVSQEVRNDYEAFLKEQVARFPHVTVVRQEELLKQTPEMYLDATHVSEETAELFTAAFHRWFQAWQKSPAYPFDEPRNR